LWRLEVQFPALDPTEETRKGLTTDAEVGGVGGLAVADADRAVENGQLNALTTFSTTVAALTPSGHVASLHRLRGG
jgi:hypothetical protein